MRTRIAQLAVLAALLAFCQAAFADVRMPQIFSDGMVLQREMPVPVWGWTDVGSKVSVSFAGQTKSATADSSGKWKILLDPLTASDRKFWRMLTAARIDARLRPV